MRKEVHCFAEPRWAAARPPQATRSPSRRTRSLSLTTPSPSPSPTSARRLHTAAFVETWTPHGQQSWTTTIGEPQTQIPQPLVQPPAFGERQPTLGPQSWTHTYGEPLQQFLQHQDSAALKPHQHRGATLFLQRFHEDQHFHIYELVLTPRNHEHYLSNNLGRTLRGSSYTSSWNFTSIFDPPPTSWSNPNPGRIGFYASRIHPFHLTPFSRQHFPHDQRDQLQQRSRPTHQPYRLPLHLQCYMSTHRTKTF